MKNTLFFQPIDIISVKTADLLSEHQLTDSPVLIFHVKGEGQLISEQTAFRCRRKLYICPCDETFNIAPISSGGIHLYIVRLRVFSYSSDDEAMLPDNGKTSSTDFSKWIYKRLIIWQAGFSHSENVRSADALQKMKYTADFQQLMYDLYAAKYAIKIIRKRRSNEQNNSYMLSPTQKSRSPSSLIWRESVPSITVKPLKTIRAERNWIYHNIRITNAKKMMARQTANCGNRSSNRLPGRIFISAASLKTYRQLTYKLYEKGA